MPELPEVAAIAGFLHAHAAGREIQTVTVASLNVMTTYEPPATALVGRTISDATRRGKYLDIVTMSADSAGPPQLHLVLHFARAGWLRWSEKQTTTRIKMGGPISLRVGLADGVGFDVTEAGTKKSVAAAVVTDPLQVPGVARLGPDALGPNGSGMPECELATLLAGSTRRIKSVLMDQSALAGIGNAYSDEILHAARLSPFATAGLLGPDAIDALADAIRDVLTDAVDRTAAEPLTRLKGEKRSGLKVHARTGLPCPVCGDTIAEVSLSERSFQNCPTCQTGGRRLADRRTSRFLR